MVTPANRSSLIRTTSTSDNSKKRLRWVEARKIADQQPAHSVASDPLSSPSCSRSCGLAVDWCRGDRFRVGGRRRGGGARRRLTRADAVDMPAGDLAPGIVGDEDGVSLTALGICERAPGGEGAAGGQVGRVGGPPGDDGERPLA